MNRNLVCAFFVITFLQTALSPNSCVSISVSQEKDGIVVTCGLTKEESLTQINWIMIHNSNHTQLGIFHPNFGIHIPPEHFGTVMIEGKKSSLASSKLFLKKVGLNESVQICCQFVTFPSGILEQCWAFNNTKGSITKAEAHVAVHKMGLLGQLGAMMVGSFLSLSFLIILICLCQRCFCRRKQILEIQQVTHTVSTTPLEAYTEEANEELHNSTPSSFGFDPRKLYAKIKEDLHYGRLWRAYQGSERVSRPRCLSGSRQIYYLLSNNSPRPMNEEHTPESPDTSTSLESSN